VLRHQAGERNRQAELSGQRFEDSELTRDGMNRRDVAVTHSRDGDEAIVDPGLRYWSIAGSAGPRLRMQNVQKLMSACPREAEPQINGDRTLDALACDRAGTIPNSRNTFLQNPRNQIVDACANIKTCRASERTRRLCESNPGRSRAHAAACCDPSRTDSSCSELPPSAEQIIDQGCGLPAVPFLELSRRGG
jgi:hypothetical protein